MYLLNVLLIYLISAGFVRAQEQKKSTDKYLLHKSCEVALHKLIDEKMRSSLVYKTMAAHFNHNSVARAGFTKFYSEKSEQEDSHATKLVDYLNLRGGRFAGFSIKMPSKYKWRNGLEAVREAISLDKHVNNKLHHLHDIASSQCEDQHLMDFLESELFGAQVKSIDELYRLVAVLREMDTSMGEYLLDQQLSHNKMEL